MGLEPMISRTTIWRANQLHHTHHIYYLSNYVVQLSTTIFNFCGSNEPGGIRTLDLRLRRPLLYPAELQTHKTSSLELFLKASGFKKAGDGNRTHVSSLEGWCSTIELHPHIGVWIKSGWQDSNLRPPGPKPGALAKLSHTPMLYCPVTFLSISPWHKSYYIARSAGCQPLFLFFLKTVKWKVYFHFE